MSVQEQIARYDGLTPAAIIQMAGELQLDKLKGNPLTDQHAVCEYLQTVLKSRTREIFICIFLDTKHYVIASEELFKGSIDSSAVYPRVIAEKALRRGAAALIIAHNHPSGNTEPSSTDQAITRRIKEAIQLFEIRLLDHFIIGDGPPISMVSRGLM